jgi:hypothetical protein
MSIHAAMPNPSIERTPYGTLRVPSVAAHVERYASAAVRCFSNVGLFGGLRARSAVPRALRMSSALSVPARFAPRLVRSAVLFAQAGACSRVRATQTPRRECVLREPSLACTPRRGRGAAPRCLRRLVLSRTQRRSTMAAQRWACASGRGFTRSQNALRCALSRLWGSRSASASRLSGVLGPGSHNPLHRADKQRRASLCCFASSARAVVCRSCRTLAVMNIRATALHVAVCIVVGGVLAAFTPAKWLAASLWVSAAMFINGALAAVEDARPGGFDNPSGADTPSFAKGLGATKFALQSLLVTVALAGLGFLVQFA